MPSISHNGSGSKLLTMSYHIGPIAETPPEIAQWWYDFSLVPQTSIEVSMGIELSDLGPYFGVATSFYPVLGVFLLADGDVPSNDLWSLYTPAVVISDPTFSGLNAYEGFNASATIANPNAKRQILAAWRVGARFSSDLNPARWNYRSLTFDVVGV